MTTQIVTLHTDTDGIAHVKLNRPEKHNALNMEMFFAIDKVIRQIKKDPAIRVVILSGEGPSFCSGLDVQGVLTKPANALKLLWKWLPGNANLAQRVSIGWRRLNVPVIAVLHGNCWGGGMQIALGSDYRIASPDCQLAIMEARWGLIPDMGGTPGLLACVSGDHAMRLAMTAESISAQQAEKIGLISQVSNTPLDDAQAMAKQLVARSPDTNGVIKRVYHGLWAGNERRILAKETLNQIKILFGKNQRIAVKRELGKTDIPFQ
ncbi:crotonase/enoyl-CoA hydratase family protein [Alteromonas sediminis]|uniref:Crotonase/enoyl-CoA hydratase family protein n=1 Tax=Alteromonas sediminis TaxID=2259342 RepID=A0A3N5XVY5_9ALTE|nr:crotonase/enoyl-CoA hydratase family protein [Alteromonas sediminis]RPJ64907.1 crotonase/enoyl-CoA hydratase family protein [Alteromonas sediminis]